MSVQAHVTLNNGQKMPTLGLGVWQADNGPEVINAVKNALSIGYRLLDTAKIYGNEEGVGQAVRESGVPRKDIFVTTKLWNDDQGHDSALRAFAASLERLAMEYVDLYLIHWPGGGKRIESWLALEELYRGGQARSIGVSNFNIDHLEEIAKHKLTTPAVNQVEFHPYIYDQQKELLAYCKHTGIVFEAYSPLARGRSMNERLFSDIGFSHRKSPAQVMLRWALQHGAVVIPKSTQPDRIRENFELFDFSLSDEEMDRINNLSTGRRAAWDPSGVS